MNNHMSKFLLLEYRCVDCVFLLLLGPVVRDKAENVWSQLFGECREHYLATSYWRRVKFQSCGFNVIRQIIPHVSPCSIYTCEPRTDNHWGCLLPASWMSFPILPRKVLRLWDCGMRARQFRALPERLFCDMFKAKTYYVVLVRLGRLVAIRYISTLNSTKEL